MFRVLGFRLNNSNILNFVFTERYAVFAQHRFQYPISISWINTDIAHCARAEKLLIL